MYSMTTFTSVSGVNFPAVDDHGVIRVLAALPPTPDRSGLVSWKSASKPHLDRSDWQEYDRTDTRVPIRDQHQHGSCCGHGSSTGFSFAWMKAGGGRADFSPTFIYGLGNGGRDAGMQVAETCKLLKEVGICLESEVPEDDIWQRDYPKSAWETAKRYRIAEAYSCEDFDDLGSAQQLGWDIVFGIMVGAAFGSLDGDGVPGVGGNGGHCLCAANGMKKSSRWGWLIKTQNSWGTRYGLGGYCWLSERHFQAGYGLDAYAIKVVSADPEEEDDTPSVRAN